jgi:GT2 family glycosyltransferase
MAWAREGLGWLATRSRPLRPERGAVGCAKICVDKIAGCKLGSGRPVSSVEAVDREGRLAVVVLTYGSADKVIGLLSHLGAESSAVTDELIVIHNPSESRERLVLPTAHKPRVVELPTNVGYVGGMNAGIAAALKSRPEFVLLLTHDVRISANSVRDLQTLMCARGELGILGPVLCTQDAAPYSAGILRSARVRMKHRKPSDGELRDAMTPEIWTCAALDG